MPGRAKIGACLYAKPDLSYSPGPVAGAMLDPSTTQPNPMEFIMDMDLDPGTFDPPFEFTGGGFVPDGRYSAATFDERSAADDLEDAEDLDILIALGLHMSD
jgi:hypothetical protein